MAGLGFVGAGGAAGTYEGLRDWMQGRRQKVVQGQRDEDRLREQALQNQALAAEAADREYDMARQRVIDERAGTTFANQQTEFAQGQTAFQQEQAARLTPEQMADVFGKIDASDLDGLGKIGLKLNIQKAGTVPREAWDLLAPKPQKIREVQTVNAQGRPVTKFLPEDQVVNQTFEEYRAPVQGSQGAPSGSQWVTPAGGGGQVYRVPQAGDSPYEKPTKGGKPPTIPAKQQEGLIGADSSEALLNQMADLYQAGAKDKVGPVSGRYTEAMQMIGADKDENWAKFVAASSTIESDIIRAVTGAAVGKQEEVRIVRQIPRPWDPPVQWQAKYQQSIDNMRQLRTGIHQQIERAATHAAGGDISPGVMLDVTRPAAGAKPKFTIIDSK
jgi:hypothetical protein